MRKRRLWALFAVTAVIAVFFCACGKTENGLGSDPANSPRESVGILSPAPAVPELPPEMTETESDWQKLSESERNEIAHAYCTMISANYYERVFAPDIYYGEYNGAYVILEDLYKYPAPELHREEIAGVIFDYNDGNTIEVCKKGRIVPILEAYNSGWLADEDIKTIGKIHEQSYYAYGRGKENIELIYDSYGNILVSDGEVKKYHRIDEESDNYVYGRVLVVFTHKASMEFRARTLEDFPEIEAIEIDDMFDTLWMRIEEWQKDHAAFPERDQEYYRRMERTYHQMACLYLKESTAEATIKALELLQKRTDILCAEPDYLISVCD